MKHFLAWLVFSLLLILPLSVVGQNESTDGWTIESRCASEPTTPPDEWTFAGTIFMRDLREGIRAINATIPTSHFVLFEDEFIDGAALSPDGRWYAVPGGTTSPAADTIPDLYYHVNEIRFYSTDGRRELYTIPWDMTFRSRVETLRWLDNDHIIYPKGHVYGDHNLYKGSLINEEAILFLGRTEYISNNSAIFSSPDWTRLVYKDLERGAMGGDKDASILYNTLAGEPIIQFFDQDVSRLRLITWTPDSAYFVTYIENESELGEITFPRLVLYSRDGVDLDTIQAGNRLYSVGISPDGRYLNWTSSTGLSIADLQAKTVTEICGLTSSRTAWSPNSQQIAFRDGSKVYVYDVQSLPVYFLPQTFAPNTGYVVAWGAS